MVRDLWYLRIVGFASLSTFGGGEATDGEDTDKAVITPEEKERWLALKRVAKETLRTQPKFTHVPRLEEQLLGSRRGLEATNSHVDFELMNRHSGGSPHRRTS